MGKVTGFLEYERHDRGYDKPEVRVEARGASSSSRCPSRSSTHQAARCMDCGIPFCHTGCPVNNLIPDWNNLVYRGAVAERAARAALDQQLPGVHRPHLPRAVRGGLHAEHRRQPGHHQDDRVRHRRSRLAGGLDRPARARAQDGQARGRGRIGPGRPRLRPAARARRPRRDSVREVRPHRRPAALRHPRLQDGKAPDRPAHRADAGGGRDLRAQYRGRRLGHHLAAPRRVRRAGAVRRHRMGARPGGAGARSRRHPFRHGLPAPSRTSAAPAMPSRWPRPTARSAPRASTWW